LASRLIEALSHWTFQPAQIDGKPVSLKIVLGVRLAPGRWWYPETHCCPCISAVHHLTVPRVFALCRRIRKLRLMQSTVSGLSNGGEPREWKVVLRRVVRSRWTFAVLQVLDLLTTLAAFHMGAFEVNPLVAHLTTQFGRLRGVLTSKVIAVIIALGVKKRLWIVNLFYTLIVLWNIIVIMSLSTRRG